MRLRHITGCEEIVENSKYCIHLENIDGKYNKIDVNQVFDNKNPINLELGMGKGQFICNLAKLNKNINYIGIEKYPTVMLKAFDNYENIYLDNNEFNDNNYSLSSLNLKFICTDVRNLTNIFDEHIINKIYLNFSDPWPKKRHENRRLTSIPYLKIYEKLLIKNGIIEFKTDNRLLFDFSVEQFKNYGLNIDGLTYDLHNDNELNKNNIMTEYEEKFSSKGNKIYKVIASFK